MVVEGGTCGAGLGHKDGALMHGTTDMTKEASDNSLGPSCEDTSGEDTMRT